MHETGAKWLMRGTVHTGLRTLSKEHEPTTNKWIAARIVIDHAESIENAKLIN
jgi:hypothetical protein